MKSVVLVRGRQAGQFWVRAFELEGMVEKVRAEVLRSVSPGDHAVMPVLISFRQDEEFSWLSAFALFVDAVGVIDAHGAVYFTDKEDEEETRQDARTAGEIILKGLHAHLIEIRETIPFTGGEK